MYEPIRTKSVHSMADDADFPHRSREEELDIQLAGHLAALLAVTDELRALAPAAGLDTAAERLASEVARLRGGAQPARSSVATAIHEPHLTALPPARARPRGERPGRGGLPRRHRGGHPGRRAHGRPRGRHAPGRRS